MKPAHMLVALLGVAPFAIGCGSSAPQSPSAPDSPSSPSTPSTPAPADLGAPAATDAAAEPPPPPPAPPTKKVLDFVWQGESDYYMCGPSATRMALSTRMTTLPSQDEIGTYMGTTTDGTDYIGLVRGALNHYFGITSYAETDLPDDPPSQSQQTALEAAVVASIDAGYGLVANVVSGWRPPGYPSGTIYHYVAVVGYDAGGDKVLIADPAATGCGDGRCGNPASAWYQLPKSYWIATSDLGVWITPKGYTSHP